MSADPLSNRVRALLDSRVESVTQLDILLLVHAGARVVWTGQRVAAELRIGEAWAEEQLSLLARRGLVEREGEGYRFAPKPDLESAVAELARAYQTHPVTVVAAIYARPDRKLRNFADAFRLRKESEPPPGAAPAPESRNPSDPVRPPQPPGQDPEIRGA